MVTAQTNRGAITANSVADITRLRNAGSITLTEAAWLQILLSGGDPADLIIVPGDPDPRPAGSRGRTSAGSGGSQNIGNKRSGTGAGGTPAPRATTQREPVGQSDFTGFLQRRGVGQAGIPLGSAAGRFIRSQFDPLASLFQSQGEIAAASNQNQGSFADFTGGLRNIGDRSNLGSTVLSDFFNLSRDQRVNAGLTFERAFDEDNQLIEGTGDANIGFLQNLLQQGTRGTRGRIGSNFISRRLPFVREQFELNQPGGSFLDFVRNRFGL